jgi:CarD family transcriptional regulator
MFCLHERVVYPGHGIAEVNRVIERNIGGVTTKLLELRFLHKDMTVLVPLANINEIGLRKLSTKTEIDIIYKNLAKPTTWETPEIISTSWSKKSKKYQSEISSGDIFKISKIYMDLKRISLRKELSFGERALLQQAETLLAQEISMVQDIIEDKAKTRLRSFFSGISGSVIKASEKRA